VAWCIDSEGRKHLLHLAVGNKESEACWAEFCRHMVSRGLKEPTTVTSDGAPGLIKAVEAVFPRSLRVRCWFHRLANVRSKLPDERPLGSWPRSMQYGTPRPWTPPGPLRSASLAPTGGAFPQSGLF
jgi:hypothetical protein